jgi:S-adenosylmethionine:diacylglycerol 3-amino-3-carboxypropyl transferase
VGLGEPVVASSGSTPWEHGRFDARRGPRKVLFGRMYEDAAIELSVFPPASRVFCIASAGCTAMKLALCHEVVAVDINPDQLAYAERRIAGAPMIRGTAEGVMDFGRALAPLVGWSRTRIEAFLDLDEPVEQTAFWRRHLDTRRFRAAVDGLLSFTTLRAIYASPFLGFLPPHLGPVMRARMERCFARNANRSNPYARALLLGELSEACPPTTGAIELVHDDAAAFLEHAPSGSFAGFTLSNILDGANDEYRRRLFAAVRHAATPGAIVVLRSFGEPTASLHSNRAGDDRSMLWGVVDVRPADAIGT